MAGQLDGLEAEAAERLERGIERGRLDDDCVARTRHRLQRQRQCLERAVGDQDALGVDVDARARIAERDLPPQPFVAGWKVVHDVLRGELAQAFGHRARQLGQREEIGAGEGRTQWHEVVAARGREHVEDEVAYGHRPGARRRRSRRRRGGRGRPAHIEPGPGPRFDQPPGLQQVIGLEHGGRAHAPGQAGLPDRRQAGARGQGAAADEVGQVLRQAFVALHERRDPSGTDMVFNTGNCISKT